MVKAKLKKSELERDPHLMWNALIFDVCYGEEDEPRTDIQQSAYYCLCYDGEVQNGGHHQFFENNGLDYARKVMSSLERLGLIASLGILTRAYEKAIHLNWGKNETVEDFVEAALEGLFAREDDEHYSLNPQLLDSIQVFAATHQDDFFEILDN